MIHWFIQLPVLSKVGAILLPVFICLIIAFICLDWKWKLERKRFRESNKDFYQWGKSVPPKKIQEQRQEQRHPPGSALRSLIGATSPTRVTPPKPPTNEMAFTEAKASVQREVPRRSSNQELAKLMDKDDPLSPKFRAMLETCPYEEVVSWLTSNINVVQERTKENVIMFFIQDAMDKRLDQLGEERRAQEALIDRLNASRK
jgi:hypothetical protein